MKIKEKNTTSTEVSIFSNLMDDEIEKKFRYSPAVTARQYQSIFCDNNLNRLTAEEKVELFDIVNESIDKLRSSFEELKRGNSFRSHAGYKAIVSKLKEMEKEFKFPLDLTEVSNFCDFFGIETGAVVQDFGYHLITPSSLSNYVKQFVIGQDDAVRTMSTVFYNHLLRCNRLGKKVDYTKLHRAIIAVIGPSGTGKTYASSLLCALFSLPHVSVNLSSCVSNGIIGSQVDSPLTNLLILSRDNQELAYQGLVVYDEVDKIGLLKYELKSTNLQSELLSIMEGKEMEINDSHQKYSDRVRFKTDNLCLVFAGAFQGIEKLKSNGTSSPIGFYKSEKVEKPFQQYSSNQLIEWGLMPEFVGRLSAFAYMKPLGVDEIKNIITKAKNTALTKYQEYFRVHDCELILTSQAIGEISKVVASQGLGARYINVMLDAVLHEHIFRAPEYSGKTISITAEDILRTKL